METIYLINPSTLENYLLRSKMNSSKPMYTLMALDKSLFAFVGDYYDNPSFYRSILGTFQYTSLTKLDISFDVNKVCHFMEKL